MPAWKCPTCEGGGVMFGAPCIDCAGTGDGSKRRPGERRTMIDDMQGLFSHVSDAYRAGRREGRSDVFAALEGIIIGASVAHETAGNDAAFRAVQAIAKQVRELKAQYDAPQPVI